jgi:hypothetical protein
MICRLPGIGNIGIIAVKTLRGQLEHRRDGRGRALGLIFILKKSPSIQGAGGPGFPI